MPHHRSYACLILAAAALIIGVGASGCGGQSLTGSQGSSSSDDSQPGSLSQRTKAPQDSDQATAQPVVDPKVIDPKVKQICDLISPATVSKYVKNAELKAEKPDPGESYSQGSCKWRTADNFGKAHERRAVSVFVRAFKPNRSSGDNPADGAAANYRDALKLAPAGVQENGGAKTTYSPVDTISGTGESAFAQTGMTASGMFKGTFATVTFKVGGYMAMVTYSGLDIDRKSTYLDNDRDRLPSKRAILSVVRPIAHNVAVKLADR